MALWVNGVMEGVGMSPVTFCFFVPLFGALIFHPRTDASSSSMTQKPCGMGSLGWATAKWAAILYNQTVVVHRGQFTGRLVQGFTLVAIDIRLREIVDGCDGREMASTTIRAGVGRDCNMDCPLILCSIKTANIGA